MPRQHSNRRKTAAAAVAILLLAMLLAACGGGGSSSTSSSSSTKTSASATKGRGQFAARGAALRTCLKKAGITLPEGKPGTAGSHRPGGPFGAGGAQGGGFQLPKGVTRAQLQAALKQCGGGFSGAGRRFGGARNSQRLAKFAACMRTNGVNLPTPNTTGKGPIFDTKGIDTTSAAFKAADAKCVKELRPAGAEAGGPGGGAPGTGAPGAGAPGGEAGSPPA